MRHSRTIVDPCYPVFRYDGLPVSQSLYEQYIAFHCEELRDNGGIHERRNDDLQSRSLPSELTNVKLSINSNRNSIARDAREGTLLKIVKQFFFKRKYVSNVAEKKSNKTYNNNKNSNNSNNNNSVVSVLFEMCFKHLF